MDRTASGMRAAAPGMMATLRGGEGLGEAVEMVAARVRKLLSK
jgi:hypothetical protein